MPTFSLNQSILLASINSKKKQGPNQPLLVFFFFFFESNFTNVTNRANFHFLSYCMQTNKQTILSTVTFFCVLQIVFVVCFFAFHLLPNLIVAILTSSTKSISKINLFLVYIRRYLARIDNNNNEEK